VSRYLGAVAPGAFERGLGSSQAFDLTTTSLRSVAKHQAGRLIYFCHTHTHLGTCTRHLKLDSRVLFCGRHCFVGCTAALLHDV
jgi:hypothetical protein